jgi:hypothetical protein
LKQERPSTRYIKHRRNSYSSNNINTTTNLRHHQSFLKSRPSGNPATSTSSGNLSSFVTDDLSLGSSSSDRGICIHSASDLRDFDTDQLIGFRDRYSRRERDEEAISLAFLYESAAVYKYRAARGQVN